VSAATPGQAAYEAAWEWDHRDEPFLLEPWSELNAHERECWDAVASAVAGNLADAYDAARKQEAVIAAAAPAAPQPAPGDWWICDGPLPDARKLLGPFATQELALNVRTYVEKAEKRSDLWVDDEPQQPQPAPDPAYVVIRRRTGEYARAYGPYGEAEADRYLGEPRDDNEARSKITLGADASEDW
jgi:hypothetical protein